MKSIANVLFAFTLLVACGKTAEQSDHDHDSTEADSESPNEALYNQVMDVHDEVMPRMEDIYKLKKDLQEQIANTPDMVVERKQQLEAIISNLDSANNAMMDWMHKFEPLPDSIDQEKAREYLESEIERIKKVKELMNESIEKAEAEVKTN
jgi:TolA-binding protein